MAKNTIATAWVQVLPSLEGLHSALVRASAGAVLTPTVQPVMKTSLFTGSGAKASAAFAGTFNKRTTSSLSASIGASLRNVADSFGITGRKSAGIFSDSFKGISLWNLIGAASAISGINKIKSAVGELSSSIVQMGDTWARTTAMLQNAVGSTENYGDALNESLSSANKVGVTVDDFVQSASRLRTLAPETIPDYKTAAKFSELLDMNMVSTGASTQEANSAMRQITQALGKGIVNGDELNSIMENAPQIARMLAKHLGVSVGDLKELGKENKILGTDLRDTVLENATAIEEQFSRMPITIDRAANTIRNTFGVETSEAFTKINTSFASVISSLNAQGLVDAVANAVNDTLPMFDTMVGALQNVVSQFAPIIANALNSGVVYKALKPFSDMLVQISQNSNLVGSLSSAFNNLGTVASVAFGLAYASSDKLLGRVPVVGRLLVGLKTTAIEFGRTLANAFGSGVSGVGRFTEKLGSLVSGMAESVSKSDNLGRSARKLYDEFTALRGSLDPERYATLAGLFDDIADATLSAQKSGQRYDVTVRELEEALELLKSKGVKVPQSLSESFESFSAELGKAQKKAEDTSFSMSRLLDAVEAVEKSSGKISWTANISTPDVASKMRDEVTNQIRQLTGIKIPDFLSPAIGSMVSLAFNQLNGFANIVESTVGGVGAKIQAKLSPTLTEIGTRWNAMFKEITAAAQHDLSPLASRIGDAVNAGMDKARAGVGRVRDAVQSVGQKFPIVGKAASAAGNAIKGIGVGGLNVVRETVDRLAKRFPSLGSLGRAAFAKIGSAATTVAGGALKGFGKTVSGVGKGISALGGVASRLGVTGALFTGLTTGFQTLFKLDPSQMAGQFDDWQKSLDKTLTDVTTKLPAMSQAFAQALPGMVTSISAAIPSIIDAIGSSLNTILPVILQLAPKVVDGFTQILSGLPALIAQNGPAILTGVGQLVSSVASAIPALMTTLGSSIIAGVNAAITAISDNSTAIGAFLGMFASGISTAIQQLGSQLPSLLTSLGSMLASALPQILPQVSNGIVSIVTSISGTLPTLLPALMQGVTGLITGVVAALPGMMEGIISALPTIIGNIATGITNALPQFITGVTTLIDGLVAALPTLITSIIAILPSLITTIATTVASQFPTILNGVLQIVSNLVSNLPSMIGMIISALPGLIVNVGSAIVSNFPTIISAVVRGVAVLVSQLPSIFAAVVSAIPSILVRIASAFVGLGQQIASRIRNVPQAIIGVFSGAGSWLVHSGQALLEGLWNGISGALGTVKSKISDALGSIRRLFPFSPAKEGPFSGHGYTSWSGRALMRDFGKGAAGQADFVKQQISSVMEQLDFTKDARLNVTVGSQNLNGYTGTMNTLMQQQKSGVTIEKVEASPLSDVELVARRFGYALDNQMIGAVRA